MATEDDLFAEEGPEPREMPSMPQELSDRAIEQLFQKGRLRVLQEKNDFFLPHVVDFIKGRKWGNLRPEYQRRLRWEKKKKSKLIESFIMNVPVPPVFLYETTLGRFEVMDGQQRLTTILEFMENDFELSSLEIWPSLNGRRFNDLPSLVKRGLERSKISAIILVSDVGEDCDDDIDLRAQVFDRINSGGERLNAQELRNSLYHGSFNDLLVNLSAWTVFTNTWGIPNHKDEKDDDGRESQKLKSNNLYKRMLDTEIVLRFFAFRDSGSVKGSVSSILTGAMKKWRNAPEEKIAKMNSTYKKVFTGSLDIFGKSAFKIRGTDGKLRLSRPLYDAQMVAVYRHRTEIEELIAQRSSIRADMAELAKQGSEFYPTIVGRANTADSIRKRIKLVDDILKDHL